MISTILIGWLATVVMDDARAPLQPLNDFIGDWKGMGAPEKKRPDSKELWNESINWGWRFKDKDAWLTLRIQGGKYFQEGELRYLADKKAYQLTLTDAKKEKQIFEGDFKEGYLNLDRKDPKSKETQRITMNSAGEGVRFIYRFSHKPEGRTLFTRDWQVAMTREGESFAAKEKKNECIVSGGLGTMPLNYKGQTYYVCCTGCRDAFNEDPQKYIKEAAAKKK